MSKRSRYALIAIVVLVILAALWCGGRALMQLLMKMHGH